MSDINLPHLIAAIIGILPSQNQCFEDNDVAAVALLQKAIQGVRNGNAVNLCQIEAVLDKTWEELNIGHWSAVSPSKRGLYSYASLYKVVGLLQSSNGEKASGAMNCVERALKAADMGLLLGGSFHQQLTHVAHLLSSALVIGCLSHWPALRRWTDLNYLTRVAGPRTVPVELGSSYAHSDWSQQLMTLGDFVRDYIKQPASIGYLAQHQLFEQVPELLNDIRVPDYCCQTDKPDDCDAEPDINAWFGPAGTVSPLHYDPKHNLLAQVVGDKRVLLYDPSLSGCLYPHEGRLLQNTAQVDPECPDYSAFPKYRAAEAHECHLFSGDMLYIPPRWWHHVRAMDTSFSVSFWWE